MKNLTKLEELIKELCPAGVKHVSLGDVCNVSKGIQFNKTDMNDDGTYPVINGGINPSGYIEQYNQEEKTITISQGGASAGYVNWIDVKFWAGAHCYVIKPKLELLNRYAYHFIKSQEYKLQECQYGAGIPALAKSTVESLKIPVPPLEVQREIVRILDNFTELTAELTTELTARKKQYEYYKEYLLAFKPEGINDKSVKLLQLCDLCNVSAGGDAPKKAMSKEKTDEYSIPIISNGIGANAFYGYTNIKKVSTPSVTIAARGTIGYAEYRDYPYFPIIRLLSVAPKDTSVLNTKYLYYCLQGKQYSVPTGGIPQLTAPELKKVKIFVPTIEEQMRIVAILDRFDALCNDISTGLPAEIEARQKQYEYYRDKLLTFKELSV